MISFAEMKGRFKTGWGFSMVEMTVVISIIGILASIAISSFGDLAKASKQVAVRERAEWLNTKVKAYTQIYGTFAAADGQRAIQLLQNGPTGVPRRPGLPFVPLKYNPTISSSSSEYRVQWTGSAFKPLNAGQSGTGIIMDTTSSDMIGG